MEIRQFHRMIARILYAPTLSGDWPRLAIVRSIYQQITYLDPLVYDWTYLTESLAEPGAARRCAQAF